MQNYWTTWSRTGRRAAVDPRERQFEGRRVKQLVDALDLTHRVGELHDDHRRRHGVPGLSFESLARVAPDLGWHVGARALYATTDAAGRITVKALMAGFEATPIWAAYRELRAHRDHLCRDRVLGAEPIPAARRGWPLALAVPCDGLRGGLVVHDGPAQTDAVFAAAVRDDAGVWVACRVERYSGWAEAVAESGPPRPAPSQAPAPAGERAGAHVAPWMLAATGGAGYDTILLAWLCRVLLPDRPDAYARRFRARWAGLPCVDATRAVLAAATGLGEIRRVTAAKTSLCARGLIEHDDATRIRLVPEAIAAALHD